MFFHIKFGGIYIACLFFLFFAMGRSFAGVEVHYGDDGGKTDYEKCLEDQKNNENGDNPIDVCYHLTKRYVNIDNWGQFSEQKDVGSFAQKILQFFLAIVGGLALLAIMIGGGMIMFGGTDEVILERGKDILKYTAIGVVVVLLAVTITTVVQTVFYSVEG